MRTIVFGGSGYIGSVLVPMLLEAGHEVTVLDRLYFSDILTSVSAGLRDRLTVIRADVRSFDPAILRTKDVAIDLSGISNDPSCDIDPALTRSVNVEGGKRLIELARAAGVRRYVYSSSCSVYGHGGTLGLTEGSARHPVSLYARAKAEVEGEVIGVGAASGGSFEVVALRLATVFGLSPRMRFDLAVNAMTRDAYVDRRITVHGDGKQWRPFVHVRDVATAFKTAAEANPDVVAGQVFNIGSDAGNIQIMDLASRVRDLVPGTRVVAVDAGAELRDYNVSFGKAHDILGFEARCTIDDGIGEMHEALRSGAVNPDDRRCYTLKQYAFLLDVERVFRALAIDGSILST